MNGSGPMDGATDLGFHAWPGLLAGSLTLRPYVFAFLGLYVAAAAAEWGWRRALAFLVWASGLAFAAEWTSTRVGIPFGLYHYTGMTAGRELYFSNVPLFDPLSFAFLAYASLGLARRLLDPPPGEGVGARSGAGPVRVALTAGGLMMWLDLVIDPLAVRGERWFLGRIFYYPEPGWYFGVPLANFAGWVVVGAAIALGWQVLEARIGGRPPAWATRLPARGHHPLILYYLVLLFNVAVTAWVAEPALLLSGVLLQIPLGAIVVCSLGLHRRLRTGRPRVGQPV